MTKTQARPAAKLSGHTIKLAFTGEKSILFLNLGIDFHAVGYCLCQYEIPPQKILLESLQYNLNSLNINAMVLTLNLSIQLVTSSKLFTFSQNLPD